MPFLITFESAPFSIRRAAHSKFPYKTAYSSGERPLVSKLFTLAPHSINNNEHSTKPAAEAKCRTVVPSGLYSLTSISSAMIHLRANEKSLSRMASNNFPVLNALLVDLFLCCLVVDLDGVGHSLVESAKT